MVTIFSFDHKTDEKREFCLYFYWMGLVAGKIARCYRFYYSPLKIIFMSNFTRIMHHIASHTDVLVLLVARLRTFAHAWEAMYLKDK